MIFPVPVLTQLDSRHKCFLLFNFPLKTERDVFGKQLIVTYHKSFQSGLSSILSSENACINNFFMLHKIYSWKEQLIKPINSSCQTSELQNWQSLTRLHKKLVAQHRWTSVRLHHCCLKTYVIYVNHTLDNNPYGINKNYLKYFFTFHCSFDHYKYLNWWLWHGEMFLLSFCV